MNDKYIQYIADHLDDHLNDNIKYCEYVAENLDDNIKYAEYVAENLDELTDYTSYYTDKLSYYHNCVVYKCNKCHNIEKTNCNKDCLILLDFENKLKRKDKINKIIKKTKRGTKNRIRIIR